MTLAIALTFPVATAEELDWQVAREISQGDNEGWYYALPSSYRVTLFNPQVGENQERLWSQTKLLFGLGVGFAGFVAMLPSDVSNWDSADKPLVDKWWNNVREAPVWDRDDLFINYVGHTYFGGVYYQLARKSNFNQWNSFVYSALMSTFYWEYGLEGFAETPSIQDLFITPIGGWLYGEWAYNKEKEILANGRLLGNSEILGTTALFLLDPVDQIGQWLNLVLGRDWIHAGHLTIANRPTFFRPAPGRQFEDYWGIDIVLQFE